MRCGKINNFRYAERAGSVFAAKIAFAPLSLSVLSGYSSLSNTQPHSDVVAKLSLLLNMSFLLW